MPSVVAAVKEMSLVERASKKFRLAQGKLLFQKAKSEEKQMDETWDRLMNSHAEMAVMHQRELDRKRA